MKPTFVNFIGLMFSLLYGKKPTELGRQEDLSVSFYGGDEDPCGFCTVWQ